MHPGATYIRVNIVLIETIRTEAAMRAEAQKLVDTITQSLSLLRRHL